MSSSTIVRCVFATAPFLAMVTLTGCGRHSGGPVTTALISAPGSFNQIDLRGPIDVLVREGGESSIAVTGTPSMRSRVQTRVEGSTLIVDLDEDTGHCFGICIDTSGSEDARVTVNLPVLKAATIDGSGDLTVEATGAHPEVDFEVRGSGDVRYRGNAELVRCTLDGSGDITLRGAGKRLEARVHGSGDLRAREFPVEGGLYEIEGSGDIATVVHGGDMSVRIEGSGDLMYGGHARITDLEVSGSGSIHQLGRASHESREAKEEKEVEGDEARAEKEESEGE
jgi:hypothetical protein